MRLDLHGFTVHDAWKKFSVWIQDAQTKENVKSVTDTDAVGTL